MIDPLLRIARLEQSVFRLRMMVIAMTFVASGAAATALVIAMRTPTELRIGGMRLDEHALSFEHGHQRVEIDAAGIEIETTESVNLLDATTIWMASRDGRALEPPSLRLTVGDKRATLQIQGTVGDARMQVDRDKTTLELDGKTVTPAP